MARFLVVIFCFTFFLLDANALKLDNKTKSGIVKVILKKVLNLTLSSFTNITNPQRKILMDNIEKKIRKSAEFLGPLKREQYVGLIMDGVKAILSENGGPINWDEVDVNKKFIDEAATTIKTIAEASLKQAKTPLEREHIFRNIQKRREKYAIQRHVELNPQDAYKLNRTVVQESILKGIAEKDNMEHSRRVQNTKTRKMEYEFVDSINVNKEQINVNSPRRNYVPEINTKSVNKNIEPYYKNVTFRLPCADTNIKVCSKIKALSVFECDKKKILIDKLCDGIDDCSDYKDEHDCAIQGVDKVRNASLVMSDIEHYLSSHCLTTQINDTLITMQNEILNRVLQSQLKFIQKHATERVTNIHQPKLRKYYLEPASVRKTVHEVAVVIMTLASALKRTLCSDPTDEGTLNFQAVDDILQKRYDEEAEKTTTWSPNSCKCIEENCLGKCSSSCKTLCLQRYQISRWQCNAVSNNKSISLDLVCDGKLDCYDESDENGCAAVNGYEKFEASNLYNFLIDMITRKTTLASFESIRNKLIKLQELIKNLQKLTIKQYVNEQDVKALRNECFSEMTTIYDLTKYYAINMEVMHDIYMFLMSVNDKLVIAMKLSHIGNEKILASDGCICRENKCALQRCSKTCERACPAEPKLTRFFCGGSTVTNHSVPIEAICDGKADCPREDDEANCSLDVCRKHHFIVLRHNLEQVASEKDTTSITDILNSWKIKETAMLRVMEENQRPTPMLIRDIVKDMLHDLVMAYAGVTVPKRRSNDEVMDQFYKTALVVMNMLKSCT